MIVIFIRAIVLYIVVLIAIRLMGKGELTEIQPFQLVVILMIAELASIPMEDLGIPLINGVVAISTLLVIQILISYINLKSERARKIICGKPSILISRGKINESELRRLRININDLLEHMRTKDYSSLQDVEFAILETSGDLSIIPKSTKKPATAEDVKAKTSKEEIPTSLIIDGHIKYDNLRELNLTEEWLSNQLEKHKVNNSKEVLFAYIDAKKEVFVQKKVNR